ncbi:hypothetical protein LOAG_16130, partial [Loa loa]
MRRNYCGRSVKTIRDGWPQQSTFCDEIEYHPYQEFCNTYDAVMNKIQDITAP